MIFNTGETKTVRINFLTAFFKATKIIQKMNPVIIKAMFGFYLKVLKDLEIFTIIIVGFSRVFIS